LRTSALLEVVGVVEEAAGVLVPRSEEMGVHPMVEVIVLLGHGPRPVPRLEIAEPGVDLLREPVEPQQGMAPQPAAHGFAEEFDERTGIPVAIHVGLADAQRTSQGPGVEAVIVHAHIPGPVAPDADVRLSKDICDDASGQRLHAIAPVVAARFDFV